MKSNQTKKLNTRDDLFGRETSKSLLMKAFKDASRGYGRTLLVPGHSGVGKTSLVTWLKNPVELENGIFVTGKFDQFHQNRPYSAISQALKELWTKVHAFNESKLTQLKITLNESLGEFGFLLIELIPDFADVFSDHRHIDDRNINHIEARHRFSTVTRKFLEIVCQPENPVVIFIDDWQWADAASLELIKGLYGENVLGYYLFIASYRDEEAGATHPLSLTIRDLKHQTQQPESIEVHRLNKSGVTEMVNQALNAAVDKIDSLVNHVFRHTQGNPFYVKAFLDYLHKNQMLWFDSIDQRWYWTFEKELPDDIVDLFVKRLHHFNRESRYLISLAACLGTYFEIDFLSEISNLSHDRCYALLKPLIADGFILPATPSAQKNPIESSPPWHFLFMHDRVQQAAYLFIEPETLPEIHLKIGRLLLNSLNEIEIDERLFEILEHLNAGKAYINDPDEQETLIELNMKASLKARSATAFSAMLKFNRAAFYFASIGDGGITTFWFTNYEKALILHRDLAESEFLEGDRTIAERNIQDSLIFTKTAIERAESLNILIIQYTLLARYEDAISAGRQALAEFNISLPHDDFKTIRDDEIKQVRQKLAGNAIARLYDSPIMNDREMLTVTKLLITLGPPCYRTHQPLWSVIVPKVVNLTLDYGLVPQIGYSHTAFGGLIGWVSNDYETAREFGNLAERIMESKFESPSDQSVFYLMIGSSIRHWFKHLRYSSEDYVRAYKIGQQSGNLQYAAYGFGHNMYCRFFQGIRLDELIKDTKQSLIFSKTRLNHWASDLLEGGLRIFHALSDRHADTQIFETTEENYLNKVKKNKNVQVLCIYSVLKVSHFLSLGKYDCALPLLAKTDELIDTVGTQGLLPWPEYIFSKSIILASLFSDFDAETQNQWKSELNGILEQLRIWSQWCPENYLHKFYLLRAEIHRIENDISEAAELYDKAIEASRKNHFQQWEGLANERASQFWLKLGNDPLAQIYWQEAYNCYFFWGANAKLTIMENELRERLLSWQAHTAHEPKNQNRWLKDNRLNALMEKHIDLVKRAPAFKQEALYKQEVFDQADALAEATERLRKEIVERKMAEESLRASEERFRVLFENAPIPYQSLDENGHIIEVNYTWLNLMGYRRDEVVGKSFSDFLHPDWADHFSENFPRFKSVGEILGVEFELRKKDGTYIWTTFDGKIRRSNDGVFIQTHCVLNDITEQRKLEKKIQDQEAALRQSQKMESIGNLAGGIAHEFNNILSIIIGNNELVIDELPEWSLARENTEEIRIAGMRARDVIRQLLTFSKQDNAAKEALDIGLVVHDSMKLIRPSTPANIEIQQALSDDVYPVIGNATQINQLLINLCNNAIDAMPSSGGVLSIDLSNESVEDRQHLSLKPGQYVKLVVQDNGIGMNKEILDKVFDPYFTTKEIGKGTGIGLTIVHGIVEKHGGTIIADSHPGQGTTFTVFLPRHEGQPERERDAKPVLPTGDERVLYVDDEPSIANLGKRHLESLGYAAESTTDPVRALDMIKTHPDKFDLVISDMTMPKLTGDRLIAEILKIRPDMPTIICTGYSAKISEKEAADMGVASFVMKPLDKTELAQIIRKVLDTAKSTAQG